VGGTPLAAVTGFTAGFTPAERFLEPAAADLLIDEGVRQHVSNIVAEEVGDGRVVLFGSHPEFGRMPALDDIAPAAAMLLNAVAWQESAGHPAEARGVQLVTRRPVDAERVRADRASLPILEASIAARIADLARRTAGITPSWLGADQAMAMFGRTGREIWDAALLSIPALVAEAVRGADRLPEHILSFRPPAEWAVDSGFWGVVPLLEQIDELLQQADGRFDGSYPASEGYEHMRESPYHLVAGSYLAAVGRAAAAALLVRAFGAGE
jgi:hypothetical protein